MAGEIVPENLKKQLALAVRSIQWSYAIFWFLSSTQPGVLEWGDGYYNGDIKTRKTVQSAEINGDQLVLRRSEQLRELYESLSTGESNLQTRRPTAALSPEDLTDTEWYYLVCMSFVFNIGQGLPGRTLANCQATWLCNADHADSKIFTRSLLAKSASIQTVVCFPFFGGVIELGVTDLVMEDPNLIQHVKTSFLNLTFPVPATNSTINDDKELADATVFDHEIIEAKLIPVVECEELDVISPDDNSDDQPAEDSFMVEGINGDASQVQSWQLMDDDFSNCVHHSLESSDCISQTIVDPVMAVPIPEWEVVHKQHLQDVRLDLGNQDLHYQGVLSSLLKTSHPLILGSHFQNCNKKSSFVSWKMTGLMHLRKSKGGNSQSLLKKILFQVPRMNVTGLLESQDTKNSRVRAVTAEEDDIGASHELFDRKRKGKISERLMILKSIVPSIRKVDEVTILDDTIEYLQKLEKRVEELESCKELEECEIRTKRTPQDAVERTSDNYGSHKTCNRPNSLVNKRKACDIDEAGRSIDYNLHQEGLADNVTVSVNDKDVVIDIKCPWKEGLLLEIVDAASRLKLDSLSVQSSTIDGILFLTIKSKKGYAALSAGAIKQAIHKVAVKR